MNENEFVIREHYIDQYINQITHDILVESVNSMLKYHKIRNIRIHKDFPKLQLKELMMPYLKLHFISKMSRNKWRKADSFMKLHNMLHCLQYESPTFGRKKYVKIEKKEKNVFNYCNESETIGEKSAIYRSYFEMKVPKINNGSSGNLRQFMQNHMELNIRHDSYMIFDYQMIQLQHREQILNREMTSRSSSQLITAVQEDGREDVEDNDNEYHELLYVSGISNDDHEV
jgi:hypothetical protein